MNATLRFQTLDCPKLKSLQLSGCDHMFRSITGIVYVLPRLESLRCGCVREDSKDVVLEHQNICDIVVEMAHMRESVELSEKVDIDHA